MKDKQIEKLIAEENLRQLNNIELIASENVVSQDVLAAMGSILTNKYAEGYPGHRYYGGCEIVDKVEQLAIERVCKIYGCEYANVQPHSGSQANRSAIEAVCAPGDTILGLDLNSGGHLTHGASVSFSGKYYNARSYHVTADGIVDYDELQALADELKPKLIIGGASAYSREWDYARIRKIADSCGAVFMFDMAHIAGMVAAGLLLNPCDWADIVTSTTHKTLRGPRGGIILMKKDFPNRRGLKKADGQPRMMSSLINSSVFPANQGGPLENVVAAKAVCFFEAMQPEFVEYQKQVLSNAKALAGELMSLGYKIISGGTDNHEFLVDLRSKFPSMTGKTAEDVLNSRGITVNKNMLPDDTRKPAETSGLRLGTPAVTTMGMKEEDMVRIARSIDTILSETAEKVL